MSRLGTLYGAGSQPGCIGSHLITSAGIRASLASRWPLRLGALGRIWA